jgi:predicted metal-dependent hydrolase
MRILMQLNIEGFSILLLRKPVKNLNLRIQSTGQIQVSAPLKMPINVISGFLEERLPWIDKHLKRLKLQQQPTPKALVTGETVMFLGHGYELIVHEGFKGLEVKWVDNQIHLFVKHGATIAQKQMGLTRWYHLQMEQLLPDLFQKWQTIIGVESNSIRIKTMKTRWGSCQPLKKQITLNLSLIEKPVSCLEYVIVHELVHLLEPSHNNRFYALMSQYMPDWALEKNKLLYNSPRSLEEIQ